MLRDHSAEWRRRVELAELAGRAPSRGARTKSGPGGRGSRKLRPFVGVDGEAIDNRYVLLAASTGETVENLDGLETLQCLRFLWELKRRHPYSILVGYGFNYDANMMLGDLERPTLERLWQDGQATIFDPLGQALRFEWIPHKQFRASHYRADGRQSFTVYDVLGFFQTGFLAALRKWRIAEPEPGLLDRIEHGKAERGDFQREGFDDVRRYCLAECRMLADLMEELRRVFHDAGIRPTRWQGAGSAAAGLLRARGVAAYHRHDDELPAAMRPAVMRGYFGGRSEVWQLGELGDGTSYDLNSAYPWQAARLPALHGDWRRRRGYDPAARWAIWRVRWELPPGTLVAPFPYRQKRSITYPLNGEGCYWQDEVAAALAAYPEHVTVAGGWVFEPSSDERPFAFVEELYRLRAAAKAAGDPREKAYKLGLNSLYGKLAQGAGHGGRVPRFRSYVWAGLITSGTRARMFELAMLAPEQVVACATDGIIFAGVDPAPGPVGRELGELDRGERHELFVAGAGLYTYRDESGAVVRTRGHFRRDLNFERIRAGWARAGVEHVERFTSRRFIGLGTALGRTDPPRWEIWREWHDVPRSLNLWPDRKYLLDPRDGEPFVPVYGDGWQAGWPARLGAPTTTPGRVSDAYVPKTPGELDDAEYLALFEQPAPLA